MTTTQLIKALQEADPTGERAVIVSSDSEGNEFHLLTEFGDFHACAYRLNGRELVTGLEKLTAQARKDGFGEDDILEGGKPALILFP